MVRCGMMIGICDYDRLCYEEQVRPGTATSAPLQDVFTLKHTKKNSVKKGLYKKKKVNPDRKNKNKGGVKKVNMSKECGGVNVGKYERLFGRCNDRHCFQC